MEEGQIKTTGRQRTFSSMSHEEAFFLARQKVVAGKRFLDPCLSRELLAEELNIHRNSLSAAVNLCAGVSFPVWVSLCRISELEHLCALPENRSRSISSLALMAGFASTSSFRRMYAAIKQAKPSQTLPGRAQKQTTKYSTKQTTKQG